MGRVRPLLAWLAVAAATANGAAAGPIYDMRPLLGQPHPLAGAEAPPAPAPRSESQPRAPLFGWSRLYDMRPLLGRPHPLAQAWPARPIEAIPPQTPAPRLTPPRPAADLPPAAGVTRLYDVSLFFNQAHPLAPAPVARPAPAPATPGTDTDADESGPGDDLDTNDPLESVNRVVFNFNQLFLDYFMGPLTDAYRWVLPDAVERVVGNALDNVGSPVTLANDILQAEPGRAFDTTARLVINSTAGIGGLFDVAEKMGIERHEEDFGQTLGVWGVGEGFYLVLPLLGPSNPRDAFGKHIVDSFIDPLSIYLDNDDRDAIRFGLMGLKALDAYRRVADDLEKVRKTSIDYYGALRSLYRQRRASDIRNDSGVHVPDVDFDIDYDDDGDI